MAWPNEEPSVAPIWMIGRSRPTAAPVPIENAEASDLMAGTTGRIAKLTTRNVTMRPPITGTRMIHGPHGLAGVNWVASKAKVNLSRKATL
jgi:hypothetical protein